MAASDVEDRRNRLEQVLQPILVRQTFSSREIRELCANFSSHAVTDVLKKLTLEGVLQSDESGAETIYRWRNEREKFSATAWIDRQICGTQLTQTPKSERPRERLLKCGASNLRTAELLAILIRSGRPGESALEAGERIANRMGGNLADLRGLAPKELKEISNSVSEAAYCQIMAGIELGRRLVESLQRDSGPPPVINSPEVALEYCKQQFHRLAIDTQHEEFHIVTLDTKLHPISQHQITVGTLDASLVHPREVFRKAIRDAASAILLVHNHPSGDPTPSREDYQVTDSLDAAAKIIGIRVIDHIVVAGQTAVSIRQARL